MSIISKACLQTLSIGFPKGMGKVLSCIWFDYILMKMVSWSVSDISEHFPKITSDIYKEIIL